VLKLKKFVFGLQVPSSAPIYSATLKWFYKKYKKDEAIINLLNIKEDDENKEEKMLPFNKPTVEEKDTSDDVA